MNDIRLVGQVEAAGICESMVSLWWVYLWVQLDPRSGELNYTVMGGLTFRLLQGHQIWYWLKGDCWALAELWRCSTSSNHYSVYSTTMVRSECNMGVKYTFEVCDKHIVGNYNKATSVSPYRHVTLCCVAAVQSIFVQGYAGNEEVLIKTGELYCTRLHAL